MAAGAWLRGALICTAALLLQGCFNSGEPISPKTRLALPGLNSSVSSLAVTKIDGMQPDLAQRLRRHMKTALASERISLTETKSKAAFSLKGYGSVISNAKTITLVNIWDVYDIKNRRVHRIISENGRPAVNVADKWAAVNSTMLAGAAKNLAAQYSSWARGRKLTLPDSTAPEVPAPSLATASIRRSSAPARNGRPHRKASLPPDSRSTAIALTRITGAPGQAEAELTRALKAALMRSGYRLTGPSARAGHSLTVQMRLSPPGRGNRDIAIDWILARASGAHVATIRQRNQLGEDSLRSGWRPVAEGAAGAAASRITGLIGRRGR